jgi:lipopolysaccharide export system protein LptA
VKIFPFKNKKALFARWIAVALLVNALGLSGTRLTAQTAQPAPADPIRITADNLTTDNEMKTAEFSGNVTAVQGETRITADRLKLFYGQQNAVEDARQETSIDKIEARGNVHILFDNRVAEAEQAVYTTVDKKLVLNGRQVTVKSGQDQVTGSEIIFYRGNGRVVIKGDAGNQVKAIIHSDQRGLN